MGEVLFLKKFISGEKKCYEPVIFLMSSGNYSDPHNQSNESLETAYPHNCEDTKTLTNLHLHLDKSMKKNRKQQLQGIAWLQKSVCWWDHTN